MIMMKYINDNNNNIINDINYVNVWKWNNDNNIINIIINDNDVLLMIMIIIISSIINEIGN